MAQALWADIVQPTENQIKDISRKTKIPPEKLRYFLQRTNRIPQIDFKNYSLLQLQIPDEKSKKVTQNCIVIFSKNKNSIMTICSKKSSVFNDIEEYKESMIEKKSVNVLQMIFTEINENFMQFMDSVIEGINEIEEKIFIQKQSSQVIKLSLELKNTIIKIYRALAANRDVITHLLKDEIKIIDQKDKPKFEVILSEIIELMELTGTYRDILNTTTEIHLSTINNNLNITMKKITSWGALILVPSFIAGIFGMNFKNIPGLESAIGFEISLIIMGISIGAMYLYFKKSDWI